MRAHLERAVRRPPAGTEAWLQKPDVPAAAEVGGTASGRSPASEDALQGIRETGGWASSIEYLETQYKLLRLDTMLPLKRAVEEVRGAPHLVEAESTEKVRIYDNVYLTGLTVARDGFAVRAEFSTSRVEKKINWPQSKRLKSGTLVALTPAEDNFRTKCVVAVVASRPLSSVVVERHEKPAIHLYFGDPSQIEIDPQVQWLMVEGSNGYWEAARHVLKALQSLTQERLVL